MSNFKEILSDHFRFRKQLIKLAISDLVKTYKGAALGWAWAVIKPAITIGMYFFAFAFGLRVGKPINGYSYFLWFISGMVPWFYISEVFTGGAWSIRRYSFLVTKIRFPISTIPTFVCLSHLIVNCGLILLLILLYLVSGHFPDIYWLQIPFYILLMFLFFTAWSLFASMLSCISSDFFQLVRSGTVILLWMSSIFYDPNNVGNRFVRALLKGSPITIIVNGFRDAFINKVWFWERPKSMLCFLVLYLIMLLLAIKTYGKLKKDLPDII